MLYVHESAKIVATVTKFPFCSEEVPVLVEGRILSSIL